MLVSLQIEVQHDVLFYCPARLIQRALFLDGCAFLQGRTSPQLLGFAHGFLFEQLPALQFGNGWVLLFEAK